MLGVSASTIWYVDATEPASVLRDAEPDRDAARDLVGQLHPGLEVSYLGDEPLTDAAKPEAGEVIAGWYPGVVVVRTGESLPPVPSSLVEHWIHPTGFRHTYLCSSSPVTKAGSWGAFAHWDHGELKRSFSATPVHIIEDLGLPQVWERPFWAGEHPVRPSLDVLPDPQTLPFNPGEFAEAAPRGWLGDDLDPASITVSRFAVHPTGQVPESVLRLEEARRAESAREQEEPGAPDEHSEPNAHSEPEDGSDQESVPSPKRPSLLSRLFRRDH
ncbi:hypothetical protein DEU38_11654 [Rhodococcus sp. AG1013]|uniref:DUF6928 family protein n=1 Tax=Rhodococcus sp. AG1013 TaxID=2183996 RepID=UPI000E0A3C3B|nr:hypothetical protein [Rhodococcus sp. AG1013]RDI20505.1 hypothetical protein DEU38_11654 [Rhodococcus sp. AG1013]